MKRKFNIAFTGYIVALLLLSASLTFGGTMPSEKTTGLPTGVSQDWWTQAQIQIQNSEYDIRYQEKAGSYQSPNRAQNLRFYYNANGFTVMPRTGEDDWDVNLILSAYGRGDVHQTYDGGLLTVDKNWAHVAGAGPVMIEYQNEQDGLRQDFIISEKPAGIDPICLDLTVALHGVCFEAAGQFVSFVRNVPGGAEVLRYADLKVEDALGRKLPAHFEKRGEGWLAIVVDDAQAQYPIVIDPLSSSPSWTAESNQASAVLGTSVASAGDVNGDGNSDVIVGAPYFDNGETNEGRAFVFYGHLSTGLSTAPDWTAESNQAGALFGMSVGSAGDVNGDGYSDVIVGAPDYTNGQAQEGRAYVYHGHLSTGLSTTADWTAESNQAGAFFGTSVASAGDVSGDGYSDVIVGAPYYTNGQTQEGRAYVYHGHLSTGLSTTADWTDESNQAGALFGTSVASAGDVNGDGCSDVIIGAPYYANGQPAEGRAFVYHGHTSTGLSTSYDWIAESNAGYANFGWCVATAGDVNGDGYSDVIIGAPNYNLIESTPGSAYVYYGHLSTGLSTSYDWTATTYSNSDQFGISVASAGDANGDGCSDVIIGAPYYDNSTQQIWDEGRAYVYLGHISTGLSTAYDWVMESNQAGAFFGMSVASAGDVNGDGYSDIIIGAPNYANGETDEGRAFVYNGVAYGLTNAPTMEIAGSNTGDKLGTSVASAGDVNADGYSDVIIGVPGYNSRHGRVYIYHGSSSGLSSSPSQTLDGENSYDNFGCSVAPAGDIDGDGFSDVIVGASGYTAGTGKVYVYRGSASGVLSSYSWIKTGVNIGDSLGWAVASAGDVNGDGYSDVIISAPMYGRNNTDSGKVYVYKGSVKGLSDNLFWSAKGDITNSFFGEGISSAGDVNRDGLSDIIIGAPFHDNQKGKIYVFKGASWGMQSCFSAEGDAQNYCHLGEIVSTAGDLNGDGYSDVLATAHLFDGAFTDEGKVYVYWGYNQGVTGLNLWSATSGQAGANLGLAASAGDVNGDGYSDIIVGAYKYDTTVYSDAGKAMAFYWSSIGLSNNAPPNWVASSCSSSAFFGSSVASAGDVNGDGYSDVIVGAPGYNMNKGRAYIYYGNNGSGALALPRQFRPITTTQIVPALSCNSQNSVGLSIRGRTYYGRSDVKAQFEIKDGNTVFDGTGLNETNWTNVSTGTDLTLTKTGLSQGTMYKWRSRIKYSPRLSVQDHGPWFFLSANAMTECDFRTDANKQEDKSLIQLTTPQGDTALNMVIAPMHPTPNPFVSFTTIPGFKDNEFTVYDVTGRQVGVFKGARIGEDLPGGIYFVRLPGGTTKSLRIVKIR